MLYIVLYIICIIYCIICIIYIYICIIYIFMAKKTHGEGMNGIKLHFKKLHFTF